jgi:hypothetical protein
MAVAIPLIAGICFAGILLLAHQRGIDNANIKTRRLRRRTYQMHHRALYYRRHRKPPDQRRYRDRR